MKHKITKTVMVLSLIFGLLACKTSTEDSNSNTSDSMVTAKTLNVQGKKEVNIKQSVVIWKGHKLFGTHTGDIQLKEGALEFESGVLKSGKIVVDMSSIRATELMKDDDEDDEDEDEEEGHDDQDDLANHLKDADFFDTASYPEATFIIKEVTTKAHKYYVKGDMTIKGITNVIEFPVEIEANMLKAQITIDRTSFGIKYGSGSFFDNLGDNVIKDEFDLHIKLIF